MPRKSLHGRTCGVSRDGGRARALQPSGRSPALQPICPQRRRSPALPCGMCCDGGRARTLQQTRRSPPPVIQQRDSTESSH
ncbi:hypothetical protein AN652_14075 [Xanthomonas arboricola pv. pruni]|nr:hypothetical protein AN652_14075 [Xanthomonas arboricola pv. pruni]